jgi:hypothetical protein
MGCWRHTHAVSRLAGPRSLAKTSVLASRIDLLAADGDTVSLDRPAMNRQRADHAPGGKRPSLRRRPEPRNRKLCLTLTVLVVGGVNLMSFSHLG